MIQKPKFEAAHIAQLAQQIERAIREVEVAKTEADHARSRQNSAECALSNLRSQFTRAIADQLDESSIPRRSPLVRVG